MDRSKFWDRIANRYSKSPVGDEASYQRKLQETREYFRADVEVLEFGCGTGSTAIAHAPYVKHIQAIDFSAKMIEIARSKAEAANVENVSFLHSTIEEVSADDRTWDAVLGLNILPLLENKEDVIAKVYQLLEPGGVFVTSTVCLAERMKFLKFIAPVGNFLGALPLLKVFGRDELEASLQGAGFEILRAWHHAKGAAVFIVAKKPD